MPWRFESAQSGICGGGWSPLTRPCIGRLHATWADRLRVVSIDWAAMGRPKFASKDPGGWDEHPRRVFQKNGDDLLAVVGAQDLLKRILSQEIGAEHLQVGSPEHRAGPKRRS